MKKSNLPELILAVQEKNQNWRKEVCRLNIINSIFGGKKSLRIFSEPPNLPKFLTALKITDIHNGETSRCISFPHIKTPPLQALIELLNFRFIFY